MNWKDVEAELAVLGVPMARFLRLAQIHRSNWGKYRQGKYEPNAATTRRIQAALERLRREAQGPRGGGESGGGAVQALAVGDPI